MVNRLHDSVGSGRIGFAQAKEPLVDRGEQHDLPHAASINLTLCRDGGQEELSPVRSGQGGLTAETFLATFRSRHGYDPQAERALPWPYGIATNLLRRHARAERAQYRAWARSGIDPVVADNHADAIAANVTAEATVRRLAGVLTGLTARSATCCCWSSGAP
ncbi:hypothetical protein ABT297_39760 [Dactylosporangium sp. NPDC000555]|uniref:hypothetical protein n=1 Tax=Dactylosporangium sp. NPDC000555 TaxID=3154260 RepID=UPI00331DAD6D